MNGEGSEGGAQALQRQRVLYMWGYLPGALPQRTPLLEPVAVRFPASGYSWKDVCGGGCGFAMAISGGALPLFQLLCFYCVFFVFLFLQKVRLNLIIRLIGGNFLS